jgi:hypothetical protein
MRASGTSPCHVFAWNSFSTSLTKPMYRPADLQPMLLYLSPTESRDGITVGGQTRGASDIEPCSGLSRKWVHHVQPEMKVGKFKTPSM